MQQNTEYNAQQIHVPAALDVEAVERELRELWKENASAIDAARGDEDGAAVMRARVMNLLVYVGAESAVREVDEMLSELTARHPCRALVMLAEPQIADRDIEVFVSARCPVANETGNTKLCSEQVTLTARGRFVVELPSAATPLLVSDLPVYLWWRDAPRLNDETFHTLSRASDRVIIDSAQSLDPRADLKTLATLLQHSERIAHTAISDLNWARLNAWRALLANFYDVREYLEALGRLSRVSVEYSAPRGAPHAISPQALMLANWLASRLNWRLMPRSSNAESDAAHVISAEKDGRRIAIEFRRSERATGMQGSLARVELRAGDADPPSTFVVSRSEDGRHLETHVTGGTDIHTSRVLICADKSEVELVSRELEIISHDPVYEQAMALAFEMFETE